MHVVLSMDGTSVGFCRWISSLQPLQPHEEKKLSKQLEQSTSENDKLAAELKELEVSLQSFSDRV